MKDFKKYDFVMTDSSTGEMSCDFYCFEPSCREKMDELVKDFGINLNKFDLSDMGEGDTISGIEFQLSVYEDGSSSLDYGPVAYIKGEGSYLTVDVSACGIDGLEEYLFSLI